MKKEVFTVYIAGLLQGLALVAFPATSVIFTSPQEFNFSSTGYGGLFIPQAVLSIAASLLSAKLAERKSIKFTFLFGLAANLLSMSLLALSAFAMANQTLAYCIILLATACLGIGFGLTVPSLNNFAAIFFPKKVDAAILILNALLGLGTALAPVFVFVFIGFGIWWGLPTLMALLLLCLLLFSASLRLQGESPKKRQRQKKHSSLPGLFWLFAACALLYGMVETINGNWATIYMNKSMKAGTALSSLALCLFWAFVTAGRILFAAIAKFFSPRYTFFVLPFVIAFAFVVLAFLPKSNMDLGVSTFALAGLGCSALLPLIISFGDKMLPSIRNSVAGSMIAFYLLGYGISAFSVGPLQDLAGWSLPMLFGMSAIAALVLGALAFTIIEGEKRWI